MSSEDDQAMADGAYQDMVDTEYKDTIDELKGKITALEWQISGLPGERIAALEDGIRFALDYEALPMHLRKKLDKALNPKPKPKRNRKRGASHDRPK